MPRLNFLGDEQEHARRAEAAQALLSIEGTTPSRRFLAAHTSVIAPVPHNQRPTTTGKFVFFFQYI